MAKVERASYFMADLENKPGALLKIMQDLKTTGIGLAGLWGFGTREGKAKLYVMPKDTDELRNWWKAAGLLSEEGIGFFITGEDRTGALNKSLEALSNSGINIDAIDAVAVGGQFGSFIWVDKSDVENASRALRVM